MPTFIPALPRLSAIVRADASGELTINGTSRPLIAADAARLRAGIIARCAAIGRQVGRPVRLSVVDVTGTYQLGIHPCLVSGHRKRKCLRTSEAVGVS